MRSFCHSCSGLAFPTRVTTPCGYSCREWQSVLPDFAPSLPLGSGSLHARLNGSGTPATACIALTPRLLYSSEIRSIFGANRSVWGSSGQTVPGSNLYQIRSTVVQPRIAVSCATTITRSTKTQRLAHLFSQPSSQGPRHSIKSRSCLRKARP